MSSPNDGRKSPSDDAKRTNSNDDGNKNNDGKQRAEFDAEVERELKERSRLFGPVVAEGWVFEAGDKHLLPDKAEASGDECE